MRINIVAPKQLTDQHLIAEYHELLMATKSLERNIANDSPIPERFTLGKGHITFFKNKISYLKKRHRELIAEMRKRGFRARHKVHSEVFPQWCLKRSWEPQKEDFEVIKKRLVERISLKPEWYRYYGKHYDKEFYINLLSV